MTDRRRNSFILLLVLGLLIGSGVVIATKKTRQGLDLKGGVELVYQAKPTPAAQGHPARRWTARWTSCASASTSSASPSPRSSAPGATRSPSACPTSRTPQRAQDQVGKIAQLYFYDWEPNVIGPDGKPDPTNPAVTGGQVAGSVRARARSHYDAVVRASATARQANQNTFARQAAVLHRRRPRAHGARRAAGARADAARRAAKRRRPGRQPELPRVAAGHGRRQADRPTTRRQGRRPTRCYVLNDNSGAARHRHQEPRAELRQQRRRQRSRSSPSTSPARAQQFWQKVTREIAHRGQDSADPRRRPAQQLPALRDRARQRAHLGARTSTSSRTPTASTARNGSQISGGFTIQSAQDLANLLKTGALPIKLELISPVAGLGDARPAGAAPGPDRRPRRLRWSSRCSCSSSTACSA